MPARGNSPQPTALMAALAALGTAVLIMMLALLWLLSRALAHVLGA